MKLRTLLDRLSVVLFFAFATYVALLLADAFLRAWYGTFPTQP